MKTVSMRCAWIAAAAAMTLAGCGRPQGGSTTTPADAGAGTEAAGGAASARPGDVPLGDVAGRAAAGSASLQANPYEGNEQAITQGHELFVRMNCAGCHGYGAKGNMGPDLTDHEWRYGGTPVQVYASIHDGRPQGMPAWNPALPPDEIWKLVTYIESLGGTFPAAGYQAGIQGDRPGDNIAPEVADAAPPMRMASAPPMLPSSAAGAGNPKAPPPPGSAPVPVPQGAASGSR